jgi:site-specific DNA-methyltransferase (adenine-specific)
MKIENWPLKSIRPYPNNPRVLRNAAEKVAASIREFGWRQPIVVDADGVIVIGHSRLEAAKLLKLKQAPVHVATELSADQVRSLRIADNKTATFADWDDQKLADELAEIMTTLGDITSTGFSQAEFDKLEMQARAALADIAMPGSKPVDDADDTDTGGTEPESGGADLPPEVRDADTTGGVTDDEDVIPARRDMVPFNVLMDTDARQVVYEAIAKAKQKHGLETTADALLVVCREYTNA